MLSLTPSKSPPRSSTASDLLTMSASCGSRKSQRLSQRDSPTHRNYYSNENGQRELHHRLRSVLCHRLGLPLVCAFHGQDPGKLEYLAQESDYVSDKKNAYADLLLELIDLWPTGNTLSEKEIKLTKNLIDRITCNVEVPLKAKGRSNMVLYNHDGSMPLMLVEIGLIGGDWWKNFDRGVEYVEKLFRTGIQTRDKPPLLLAIMTIDNERQNHRFVVKLGVFLCLWKNKNKNRENDDVHISLLWHSKTCNVIDGSDAFGRLLRGVCDFSSWIAKVDDEEQDESEYVYECFGRDCCRVGDMVLRSYDTRFRNDDRSPEIYLSPACVDIVGEGTKIVLNLPPDKVSSNAYSDDMWNRSSNQFLQVIVTPYRPGRHFATTPTSFIPVICQLEKLHQKGFVHGDIRGFNILFDENNNQGYLIDFDFGGKTGARKYPEGYYSALGDGSRLGREGHCILAWHDWFALGRLIFEVHDLYEPEEWKGKSRWTTELRQLRDLNRAWNCGSNDPTPVMIGELKEFLERSHQAGWTVQPGPRYQDELEKIYGPGWNASQGDQNTHGR